eukprot:gnl/TRDRNA2_/TRDRNA2_72331_c0_seq1.p1 gnl/TRDRNA2_/TRDRNA2_72331_c0~~gnl/TRDRNA2_/TRDRNA2_72331_c0_seq1.p1  ORF type:complete len:129 (-),score=19.05 gnl/TRDRNA2_/TRDRNA2_72331_c0_seq1:189-575(-)
MENSADNHRKSLSAVVGKYQKRYERRKEAMKRMWEKDVSDDEEPPEIDPMAATTTGRWTTTTEVTSSTPEWTAVHASDFDNSDLCSDDGMGGDELVTKQQLPGSVWETDCGTYPMYEKDDRSGRAGRR